MRVLFGLVLVALSVGAMWYRDRWPLPNPTSDPVGFVGLLLFYGAVLVVFAIYVKKNSLPKERND